MLVRLVVKVLGGIWVIRHNYLNTRRVGLKRLYGFLYNSALQSKGSWISVAAKFDGEPCFPHGIYGIFISGGAHIGMNCVIFHHVTIGSNTLIDSKGFGAPTIGENCYLGAGAKIIGNVVVGRNVRIGANAVVYKDVPENCVVTSGEQKVIRKDKALNNSFYHMDGNKWVFFDNGAWKEVSSGEELGMLCRSFSKNG